MHRLGIAAASRSCQASDDGTFRVVTCSYVVPVKRLDRLVDALASCRTKIEWTHIGGGESLAALEESACRLPPEIRLHFAGTLPNREVLARYAAGPVDLFVNVSASEGLPVSIAEAMMHGIPALATDVGGTSELVDESTGWLLPSSPDAASIARAIDEIASLPADRRAMKRTAASERARSIFDAERNYARFATGLRAFSERAAGS